MSGYTLSEDSAYHGQDRKETSGLSNPLHYPSPQRDERAPLRSLHYRGCSTEGWRWRRRSQVEHGTASEALTQNPAEGKEDRRGCLTADISRVHHEFILTDTELCTRHADRMGGRDDVCEQEDDPASGFGRSALRPSTTHRQTRPRLLFASPASGCALSYHLTLRVLPSRVFDIAQCKQMMCGALWKSSCLV